MIGKIFKLVLSFLLVLLLANCVDISFPHDTTEVTEHKIKELVSRSATRSDVIERFGNPFRYRKSEISYMVCRATFGLLIISPNDTVKCSEYILLFDTSDVLMGFHETARRPEINERVEGLNLRILGRQGDLFAKELWEKKSRTNFNYMSKQEGIEGDAEAMYRVYLGMSYEFIEPVAAWEWLCKAADLGYENAQIEVAYWHRESNWGFTRTDRIAWLRKAGIHADDRVAFLWYTLAAKGNDKRLMIRNNLFSETLSEKEVAEAEDMIRNWKPGQCPSPCQ